MSQSVLLNNVAHKDLRVITRRSAALGDGVMSCAVFPSEFRQLQAHYPILFQRTGDALGFQPIALFGLREGENLFPTPDGWDAHYIPLVLERQPFLIGMDGESLMVHVDLSSPRISRAEGEAVFLPHGGNSDYLERVSSVLLAIHEGVQAVPAFLEALLKHELLESFVLDVEHPDGSTSRLAGLHAINEERLAALDAAALDALHRAGHLQAIYMAVASLSCLRDLIDRQR